VRVLQGDDVGRVWSCAMDSWGLYDVDAESGSAAFGFCGLFDVQSF
jgi:hypothetical protein